MKADASRCFTWIYARLETPEQIIAAGLEEYLQPAGVSVIEWAERWGESFKFKVQGLRLFRAVHLEVINETERRISYEDFGA